jgi:hypothetical protein
MEVAQIMKGGYDHFMKKEIHEQPDSVIQSLRGRVKFGEKDGEGKPIRNRVKLGGLVRMPFCYPFLFSAALLRGRACLRAYMCECVCARVCAREREICFSICLFDPVCVCLCV